MKYLKKFESKILNYKEGDYIILYYEDTVGKIKSINKNEYEDYKNYHVEVIFQNKLISIPTVTYENIKRLATPKEIEDYKLEIQQNKYNL